MPVVFALNRSRLLVVATFLPNIFRLTALLVMILTRGRLNRYHRCSLLETARARRSFANSLEMLILHRAYPKARSPLQSDRRGHLVDVPII